MSHFHRAQITFLVLLLLLVLLVYLCKALIKGIKKGSSGRICTGIAILLVLGVIIPVARYSYPYPISVHLEEVAQVKLTEKVANPDHQSWYCIYNIPLFGEFCENSYWGLPTCQIEGEYPPMDFSRYTYLLSFEREVKGLRYHEWDNKGPEIVDWGTSAKWGSAELSEEITEGIIFIYRFPKQAIDNIAVTKYNC